MPKPNSDTKNFSKYVSGSEELQTRELKLSEFFLRHKLRMEHVGIGLLAFFCAATIGFSAWKWGEYLFFGYKEDQRLAREQQALFQNYTELQALYAAEEISLSAAQVFRGAPGKYDFVATVSNLNEHHIAILRYKFVFPSGETPVADAAVLPRGRQSIAMLGVPLAAFPGSARLVIVEEHYPRIDPHLVPDIASFIAERVRFSVDSFSFKNDHVVFDLSNESAYSYWQPVFSVELLSGGGPVGISSVTVDRFRTGEKRAIDIRLFGDILGASDIRVTPLINVFDPSVFMTPGA